jgi:hypothetical protein
MQVYKLDIDGNKNLNKKTIATPDPESGAFLTPGSGNRDIKKIPDPGSGMNIPQHFSESIETVFWVKNT